MPRYVHHHKRQAAPEISQLQLSSRISVPLSGDKIFEKINYGQTNGRANQSSYVRTIKASYAQINIPSIQDKYNEFCSKPTQLQSLDQAAGYLGGMLQGQFIHLINFFR